MPKGRIRNQGESLVHNLKPFFLPERTLIFHPFQCQSKSRRIVRGITTSPQRSLPMFRKCFLFRVPPPPRKISQDNLTPAESTVFFFFAFVFLGLLPRHMELPRLRVELDLQSPAYTTATATQDLSCVCNLHHSSWQCRILNPLSKARDPTRNLMVPSQIR